MGEQQQLKKMKAKVIHKYEYEKDWLLSNYVPDIGEIVFYKPEITEAGEPDDTVLPEGRTEPITYTRQKNGDGKHTVNELPFEASSLEDGEGVGSVQQRGATKAISANTTALGYNTIAGCKGFYIYEISYHDTDGEGYYAFDMNADLTGVEEGDIFSVQIGGNCENAGVVVSVGDISDYHRIYVDKLEWGNYEDNLAVSGDGLIDSEGNRATFWIAAKPEWGNINIGKYAEAQGCETKATQVAAHAEGIYTHAYGKYSHTEGFGTKASYASHAEGHMTSADGHYSHSEGQNTTTPGARAHAEGWNTIASGRGAHVEGGITDVENNNNIRKNEASGNFSHAEGTRTLASGLGSHAEGYNTTASGAYSHAEGWSTTAKGDRSHAEGNSTTNAIYAHAEGNSVANGTYSHAESKSTANGNYSHSEGTSQANGEYAHAEGYGTKANGARSHSEGTGTTAEGNYSHVEGRNTQTTTTGINAHAEGDTTTASGKSSHAEGVSTTASGLAAHAEGEGTTASGERSHAEGYNTTASGMRSHAEGHGTSAQGNYSHSEGINTKAIGVSSHAEGDNTTAEGNYSHSSGHYTHAIGEAQTVIGQYNLAKEEPLFIVGNGDENSGSNAFEVHKDGRASVYADPLDNVNVANKRYVDTKNTSTLNTAKAYADSKVNGLNIKNGSGANSLQQTDCTASGDNSFSEGRFTQATGARSHAEGTSSIASGNYSHAEGGKAAADSTEHNASGAYSHIEGRANQATQEASHAEGKYTIASGQCAHSEGYSVAAEGKYAHAEGQQTYARGQASHAEGTSTNANGNYSHAEGYGTLASGQGAHSEGETSKASGKAAHAEGYETEATGEYSHAEGFQTKAIGDRSHTGGSNTIAEGKYSYATGVRSHAVGYSQFVIGQDNVTIPDTLEDQTSNPNAAYFIVGNGTKSGSTITQSNALVSRKDGRLTIGKTGTNDNDVPTKKYVEDFAEREASSARMDAITEATEQIEKVKSDFQSEWDGLAMSIDNTNAEILRISERVDLLYNNDSENIDSVVELVNWTTEHGKEVEDIISSINTNTAAIEENKNATAKNTSDIEELKDKIENIPEGTTETVVVKEGDGANSIVHANVNSRAISEGSIALGEESLAGCKAFHIWDLLEDHSDINGTEYAGWYLVDEMSEGNSYKIDDVFSITNGGNYENVGRIVYLETSTKNGEDTLYTKVYVDVFHWGNYEYNLENWGDGLIDYNGQRAAILVLSRPEIGTVEHGYSAIALGKLARATNIAAFAEGRETWAYGQGSHTEGIGTTASFASHAEGHYSHATGHYSHAEGERTESIGARSHAEGWHTIAKGMGAHAEGGITNVDYNYDPTLVNTALGDFSHVEGSRTTTNGDYSHAEGYQTFTQRTAAHAEGYDTKAIGAYSHAEGHTTTANGQSSHTEGLLTSTSNEAAHAEGYETMAKGYASHTEGGKTTANGAYAHAEGFYNFADGAYSHAEGMNTRANGERSHAQNAGTTANGDYSTAEGWGTVADGTAQTVMGCFNAAIADDGTEAAYLVIGNGTRDEERSNALVSRKDGRLTIGMDPLNNMDVTTKQYVDNYISEQISQFKKPWAQENWILTGDSVLASTDYISSYGIDLTNKRFFELINQKTGININNYAVSGMGLVRKGQGQMTIPAQCGGYAFTQALKASNSPVVTIVCSFNDITPLVNGTNTIGDISVNNVDTNTVCGALNSAITSIFSTTAKNKGNPLARLCVVTPAPWQSCTPDGINETSIMANKYVDAIIEICHLRGIPCLDLFHNSGLRPNEPTMYIESSGRTHLNEVGHQLIAPRYKAMLDTLIL